VLDRERRPSYKPSAQVKRGTEGETEDDPEEERRRGGEEERRRGGPCHLQVTREKA
jgi:hypothetical protein